MSELRTRRQGRVNRPSAMGRLSLVALLFVSLSGLAQAESPTSKGDFPFHAGDRVAWIGSSSTRIGVWPQTVEFLLRTRHPELSFEAQRFTTGGGTFATGLQNLDKWLEEFRPTLVVYNYGGNDAGAGDKGIEAFLSNMEKCVERAEKSGARVVIVTPQAADVRKSGEEPAAKREKYANIMIEHGRKKDWTVIDTHHPLAAMQAAGEKVDPAYTMLKDKIHLTNPGYIGWGYYFYDLVSPGAVESAAILDAKGQVTKTSGCTIEDVSSQPNGTLAFTRLDKVLPILPPGLLPPRQAVPLEERSRYLLTVTGLPEGQYDVACEGVILGTTSAQALAKGVNLNTLMLDATEPPKAPWAALAGMIWDRKAEGIDQVGKTRWRFEVRPK